MQQQLMATARPEHSNQQVCTSYTIIHTADVLLKVIRSLHCILCTCKLNNRVLHAALYYHQSAGQRGEITNIFFNTSHLYIRYIKTLMLHRTVSTLQVHPSFFYTVYNIANSH